MFEGYLEGDTGDCVCLMYENGLVGGKAVLGFLTTATIYCEGIDIGDSTIATWFEELGKSMNLPVCSVLKPLITFYYSGDWNYSPREYAFFKHRFPSYQMSESDFRVAIEQVNNKWVAIKEVIPSVELLIESFKKSAISDVYWYTSEDTVEGFSCLLDTLNLLKRRHTKMVRLKFV